MLHVALYQPEIPPNVGNVARHCVGMNASLHLIQPMAIKLTDKKMRRAGLDYWEHLDLTVHAGPTAFLEWLGDRKPWLVTRKGTVRFDQATYADDDVLIFGSESSGLPEEWHARWPDRQIYLPIPGPIRCYNLSNTAAIVLTQAALKAGQLDAY